MAAEAPSFQVVKVQESESANPPEVRPNFKDAFVQAAFIAAQKRDITVLRVAVEKFPRGSTLDLETINKARDLYCKTLGIEKPPEEVDQVFDQVKELSFPLFLKEVAQIQCKGAESGLFVVSNEIGSSIQSTYLTSALLLLHRIRRING